MWQVDSKDTPEIMWTGEGVENGEPQPPNAGFKHIIKFKP